MWKNLRWCVLWERLGRLEAKWYGHGKFGRLAVDDLGEEDPIGIPKPKKVRAPTLAHPPRTALTREKGEEEEEAVS